MAKSKKSRSDTRITPYTKKLWKECRRIILARYKHAECWHCYTCGRVLDEPYKAQVGHFIPSGACGAFLRYDLRNLRIQCYHCNINLGGNGAEFYARMVQENGQKYVDAIFRDKYTTVKADIHYYKAKIAEYATIEC